MKRAVLWSIPIVAAMAAAAWACSVPVFRYALERWPAAPYQVTVFHQGPLAADQQKAVDALRAGADTVIDLRIVDVSAPKADDPKPPAGAALPWVVVRYPEDEAPGEAWSGPLAAEVVSRLLDSPARRRIARRLIEGDSAVFLLLEGGDRTRDDAAEALIEAELRRLEKTLELPAPADGQWGDPMYDEKGPPKLRLAFSVVRVSRSDAAESAFVRILSGACKPGTPATEPVVFPIFGRGRALCVLAGKEIAKERLEDVCEFLVGPCSCVVKEQNPGLDLLMTVDWDAALAGQKSAIPTVDPPPLAGVSDFAADGAGAPVGRSTLVRNVILAVAGGLVLLGVAAVVVLRRGKPA